MNPLGACQPLRSFGDHLFMHTYGKISLWLDIFAEHEIYQRHKLTVKLIPFFFQIIYSP